MNTADQLKQYGYVVIKNMVPPAEVNKLYDYTLKNATLGNMDDGQVPGSPAFYQDSEVVKLRNKLLPVIENSIKMNLLSVFCYHRVYRTGAVLRMHKDTTRAEISASINLGQQGDIWDLHLVDFDENVQTIRLTPGDGLIYFGQKLYHWRGKLVNADFVSQIMFHFVDRHGKNARAAKLEVIRKIRKRCRQFMGLAY